MALSILVLNIDCGYTLESPKKLGGSKEYPQSVLEQKYACFMMCIIAMKTCSSIPSILLLSFVSWMYMWFV